MRDFTLSCHHMQLSENTLSCHHMSRARIGHETRYLRHRKSNVYTSPVCKIKQGSHNTSTPLLRSRIYSTVGIRVGIGSRRRVFLAVLRNTCFPRAIQRTVRGRSPGTSDRLIQRAIDFSPVSALRSTHPASGSHPVIARWGARAPQWRSGRPRAITIGWRGGGGGTLVRARPLRRGTASSCDRDRRGQVPFSGACRAAAEGSAAADAAAAVGAD